jgi:hypothetical protein
MSTVYLALQRSLDRKVAVKVMRRNFTGDADANQIEKRFLLEGRMLAKLPHRNIVAVYDIVSSDSLAYISMEYLGGGVLSDRMRTGLSLAEAVSVIVQIANALEFAHQRGVVHRDLKPANIMFRDTGTPVLTDFGIARYQDGSAVRLTQTGMLVGTPTYMSPEQINGLPVDGRADQYSLGVLFYELLTGAPPFRAETSIAVLMAHLSQPVPELPVEFRAFGDVIARMLAKNRDERYANLIEFTEDIKSRLINSDTLLMRLQVDPNQPSSEQLRALGFSTSTPGTGLRDVPAFARTPTPRPVPDAKPALKVPSAVPRPLTLIGIGVAAALLLGVVVWALAGRNSMSREQSELIAARLEQAERLIGANLILHGSAPGEEGALQKLQDVQKKDPGNAKAQALLDRIVAQFVVQGEAALASGNLDGASALVDQGLTVHPADVYLLALKSRIDKARAAPASPAAVAPPPAAATPAPANPGSAATASSASATVDAPAKAVPLERGELLCNALPWAIVEAVLDDNHQPIALPADASTPFVLALPAGKYTVTLRNPIAGKSVQVVASVEANKRSRAEASFAASSVQGYFARAGW